MLALGPDLSYSGQMDKDDVCPVCGAENHTCRADTSHVRVIGANIFPSLGHVEMFRVEADHWVDEVFIDRDGTHSTKKRCAARAGAFIPIQQAIDFGLFVA